MGLQGEDHAPPDIMRRFAKIDRRLDQLETARRLEQASVGAGGLTIKGGFIRWLDADGNETARFATDGLDLKGLLKVAGSIVAQGGSIVVEDLQGNEVFRADASGVEMSGDLLVSGDTIISGATELGGTLDLTGLLTVFGGIDVANGGDITVTPGGEVRSTNFDGNLGSNNPGTAGWAMGGDKAAFAQLLLRDGIIGDDKLTNLVRTDTFGNDVDIQPPGASESVAVAISVPSWATTVSVLATGSAYLAGIADSPSMELYCTIEGNQGIHMAGHVDRASVNVTAHHQRSISTSSISGSLNVSLNANPINNSGDAFGLRLALSVIVVWSR